MGQSCEKANAVFETPDLNLASFMRCRGFKIQDIRNQGGRVIFVYEDSAELRSAVLDFANDGPIPVRSFCNTLRDLKAITRQSAPQGGKDA